MWNNNLEKLNFEMEEIRIFDIFAGIGALHQSLKELGVPVRVTNLSEVDIDAIISYAAGHALRPRRVWAASGSVGTAAWRVVPAA